MFFDVVSLSSIAAHVVVVAKHSLIARKNMEDVLWITNENLKFC